MQQQQCAVHYEILCLAAEWLGCRQWVGRQSLAGLDRGSGGWAEEAIRDPRDAQVCDIEQIEGQLDPHTFMTKYVMPGYETTWCCMLLTGLCRDPSDYARWSYTVAAAAKVTLL